jgi:hypothetical protein
VLVLSNQVECEYLFSMDKKLLSEFLEWTAIEYSRTIS